QQVALTVEIFSIHAYRPLLISGQVVQTEHIVSTGIGGALADQYCFTEAFTQHAPQLLKPHTMQAYACGACLAPEPWPALPPEFIFTLGPTRVTPPGSSLTKLPPTLKVISEPASSTNFMPLDR